MGSDIAVPVVAGIAIGAALIFLFVSFLHPAKEIPVDEEAYNIDSAKSSVPTIIFDDEIVSVMSNRPLAFAPKYNHSHIPDMYMIVQDEGIEYPGEEGSYCWDNVCADYRQIIPENTIEIDRGSEIEFKIVGYKTPDIFGVGIDTIPSLNRCIEKDGGMTCGVPEGVQMPELTKLDNDFRYKVDADAGIYLISSGGNWLVQDGMGGSDASYYYKIEVK